MGGNAIDAHWTTYENAMSEEEQSFRNTLNLYAIAALDAAIRSALEKAGKHRKKRDSIWAWSVAAATC